jgi:hypothetical protein
MEALRAIAGATPGRMRRASAVTRASSSAKMAAIASGRASFSRITRVRPRSSLRSAASSPMAAPTPAPRGTITRGISSARARRQACSGPAPPKATSA